MPAGNRPARDGGGSAARPGVLFSPPARRGAGALRACSDVLEAEGRAHGPGERLRGRLVRASARKREDVRGGREPVRNSIVSRRFDLCTGTCKRQAEVAAVIVAIVPESVEPCEPSKGRIVRCFQFFTGSKMYFWIGAVTVAHGPSAAVRYWPTIGTAFESLGIVR